MTDRGPGKPSQSEEEYFVREDAEKKRKLALEMKKQMQAAEQQQLKNLHFMHCPKCGMKMHEVKMRGVDVDVCFSCNGVFLDQGELEHLQKPESHAVMSAILNWFKPETEKAV
jgi:hypothetical protein